MSKVWFITGATRGIGAAIVKALRSRTAELTTGEASRFRWPIENLWRH